jgi:hypothetical protein
MQKIYKYIRNGDSEQSIFYSTDRKGFDQEQKEDIEMGFNIEDDIIQEIKFKNLDELCDQL